MKSKQKLEEDFHELNKSKFGINKTDVLKRMQEKMNYLAILPAKLVGSSMSMFSTYDIVRFMSMEDLFVQFEI